MTYITPFYAAIFGLMLLVLSVRTLRLRRVLGIAIGDRNNPEMLRAMRVHANFVEYVPITLLLIFMLEMQGGSAFVTNLLCLVLLAGRIVHAIGVSQAAEDFRFRVFGMAMTFASLGLASAYLIARALSAGLGIVS